MSKITHGLSHTRIYNIWRNMIFRCYNPKCPTYNYYGGKGIIIYDEWRNNFKSFYDWSMSNGYTDELSIDRINSDLSYEPSNCRWATDLEQANNRCNNTLITFNGQTLTKAQWARKMEISFQRLEYNLEQNNGVIDDNIFKKPRKHTTITHNGVTKTIKEWSAETGISCQLLRYRLKNNKQIF